MEKHTKKIVFAVGGAIVLGAVLLFVYKNQCKCCQKDKKAEE
jgi:hypothetical protein